jgi:hypothetical protein
MVARRADRRSSPGAAAQAVFAAQGLHSPFVASRAWDASDNDIHVVSIGRVLFSVLFGRFFRAENLHLFGRLFRAKNLIRGSLALCLWCRQKFVSLIRSSLASILRK